jgi:hypothetical protein
MEKIGRIRKRLGNFKNLHFFFHHHPLTAHSQVPEGLIHMRTCQTIPMHAWRASYSNLARRLHLATPQNATSPRLTSVRFVVNKYPSDEVFVLCAFYSNLGRATKSVKSVPELSETNKGKNEGGASHRY